MGIAFGYQIYDLPLVLCELYFGRNSLVCLLGIDFSGLTAELFVCRPDILENHQLIIRRATLLGCISFYSIFYVSG